MRALTQRKATATYSERSRCSALSSSQFFTAFPVEAFTFLEDVRWAEIHAKAPGQAEIKSRVDLYVFRALSAFVRESLAARFEVTQDLTHRMGRGTIQSLGYN
jgi:hypothetical protein